MDVLGDPAVHTVVMIWAAQTGKTEILNNIQGFFIDLDPCPILIMQPTLQMGEAYSKDRLDPMIRDTACLRRKVKPGRKKDGSNTILHKKFPGGHVTICGSNSPASMASRPIRVVLSDEIDRYELSAGSEGDPISIADKRTSNFFNRKKIRTSTPGIKGISRIESEWEDSDQRYFHVPCPHCGALQSLQWANVKWDNDNWPSEVWYECEHCGEQIHEKYKPEMLAGGKWVATAESEGIAGFHLNAIYSPWLTWRELVGEFKSAKAKGAEVLKTFVNTRWAETWEDAGDTVDGVGLISRRAKYAAEVPADALVLTAGVDVQNNRLEMRVDGWGEGQQSWAVDYRVMWGDPERPEVWEELDQLLQSTYQHEGGARLPIAATCIDSGAHTSQVYAFVLPRQVRRVYAIKGMAGEGRPIVKYPVKQRQGKSKRPVSLFTVGVDTAKGLIYSRLKQTEPGPGFCNFPQAEWCGADFFDQLTAEKRITRFAKGYPKREWHLISDRRNEVLDCSVYSLAALHILNPKWAVLRRQLDKRENEKEEKTEKKQRRPRGKSFAQSWK